MVGNGKMTRPKMHATLSVKTTLIPNMLLRRLVIVHGYVLSVLTHGWTASRGMAVCASFLILFVPWVRPVSLQAASSMPCLPWCTSLPPPQSEVWLAVRFFPDIFLALLPHRHSLVFSYVTICVWIEAEVSFFDHKIPPVAF